MRFAITGVTGFIGMHLAKYLVNQGHEIIFSCDSTTPIYGGTIAKSRLSNLDPSKINFEIIDLANSHPEELAAKIQEAEVVIHLAANAGVRQSAVSPYDYSKSNLFAFSNVIEAVRLTKTELFLFASSSSVYGRSVTEGPQVERSATGLNLASYYASTKWANEILAMSVAESFNINSVALRFFTVYGSFGRPDMAYWTFADRILNSKAIQLYGVDGGSRSYSHVSDVVDIIEQLSKSKKLRKSLEESNSHFEAINIGNETSVTTLNMLSDLGRLLNQEPIIEIAERPKFDVDKTWASMAKTYEFVDRKPFTDIQSGLEEFTSWFVNYN
jgi:UDP-glucuronate 4-epimerase